MKSLALPILLVLTGCGSYSSIDSFYEKHKNDNQVTAFRVPRFMFSLIAEISPEMKSMVSHTKDLRYMRFPSKTTAQTQFLNRQMNQFASRSFIEIFRKNDKLKRNVVSIREKRDVVKEILIYSNDNIRGSFLYFNGNFNPNKIRQLARNQDFDSFTKGLLPQMNLASPDISN